MPHRHRLRPCLAFGLAIAAAAGTADAQGAANDPWVLAFEDQFDGTGLDRTRWSTGYTWGATHNHRAYMAPEQVRVEDGKLVLEAVARRHPDAPAGTDKYKDQFGYLSFDYTSGAVHTNGKFNFTYGKAEASCRVPSTLGTWPAFWTLNADGAWPPEIDILEVPADRKVHHYYYHYGPDWQSEASFGGTHTGPDKSLAFHTYGVEWAASSMRFLFDGAAVAGYTGRSETTQGRNMYLILNLAVGGWAKDPPTGAVFPARFECDWVRVWKPNPAYNPDLANWDLEAGALAPWGQWNSVAVSKSAAHAGTWGLRLTGAPSSSERRVRVKPATRYVFSGWGRLGASGQTAMIGVKDHGGSQVSANFTATSWQERAIEFTTGAKDSLATVFFYQSGGSGTADGDDFRLAPATPTAIAPPADASPAAPGLLAHRDGAAFVLHAPVPLRTLRAISADGASLDLPASGSTARFEPPAPGAWFLEARATDGSRLRTTVVATR